MTRPPPERPTTPPPPSGAPIADAPRLFWDQLRRIRANVQGMQTSLAEIRISSDRFDLVLAQERDLWARNETQVNQGITRAQASAEAGDTGADEIADELDLLENDWDRAKKYWRAFVGSPPEAPADREDSITKMEILLKAMVRRLGFLTIPGRVCDYLARQRIGGVFEFHEAFRDELPSEDDRVALLRYLKGSPEGIYGVIDVETGRIWATSPDPKIQRRSYLTTALILIGGLLGVVAASQWNVGSPFVTARRNELAVAYLAVAAGVLVHIMIDLYKQSRSNDPAKSWTAVNDLVLWGHAHQVQMYITAFSVWAGLIAMAGLFGKVEATAAFIAGYSLDSFLDVALKRFSSTIDAGTVALKKQITPN